MESSNYFGWDVINYAETLPENLQDTKWQLFYLGALNGETDEKIYLISKEYIKNTLLPIKNGTSPIIVGESEYKAKFSESGLSGGVLPEYTGSVDILQSLQKYNKKFFSFLNGDTSENADMKAVAYMMDTEIWANFKGEYAEYAIGGPSLELLIAAYNKYAGTNYEMQVTRKQGYQSRINSSDTWSNSIRSVIDEDKSTLDSPYSITSISDKANGYYISSPSNSGFANLMFVGKSGSIGSALYYSTDYAFRPIVVLNSAYTLEKAKDLNGNDAFRIIHK